MSRRSLSPGGKYDGFIKTRSAMGPSSFPGNKYPEIVLMLWAGGRIAGVLERSLRYRFNVKILKDLPNLILSKKMIANIKEIYPVIKPKGTRFDFFSHLLSNKVERIRDGAAGADEHTPWSQNSLNLSSCMYDSLSTLEVD